ncbi:MAG: extracellular solute-binding protein, partial [Oscillospiraceae bacterium]|nr:extracellular solute-binding protein [Oscillospiraceae bacterium]
ASRIQNGEQMLLNVFMSDFNSLQEYAAYFGGKATYIGFPNESGNGSMISGDAGYAMSSACKNKEAAWEFLRIFFTEDYQKEYVYNFPSNIKAYELKEKDAMTPIYRKDENGNFLLDEDGNRIEESRGGMGFEDGTTVEFYAITQEQADQIRELIASTTHTVRYDDSINSIVNEVVEAYYSNQKSAEETAKLVQSRVSLYVNEQR